MTKIFEGKTEQEAIELAAKDLGLGIDQFEVEILEVEEKKGLFFKKANVKIKVYYELSSEKNGVSTEKKERQLLEVTDEIEAKTIEFLDNVVKYMGFNAEIALISREEGKFVLDITSDNSSILIGKKGKNLDALQLLVNVFLNTIIAENDELRAVVDIENYRERRAEAIVRNAIKNADMVIKSKSSRLLEPMNPYERRLVHTALSDHNEVITQSEGEGLLKQVRILYKGSR